nr:hypothetical protein [Bacteroidota bacterium]
GHWPGGVFFRIIEKETSEGKVYTFFSWMGAKKGLGIRVIECMVFDSVGSPVFGTPVFLLPSGKINCRVIFEFTDEIPFHLNYEKQDYPGKKRKKTDMIVFNHLSGNNPRMGKMFLAPVPDYSIFDALIFENDHWTFYGDIDVRIRDESQMQLKPSHRSVVEPDGK